MGGDLTDVTTSGAKDASGNIILPPPERHMSISTPASSGLSPAAEDVTAAYIRLLQRRESTSNYGGSTPSYSFLLFTLNQTSIQRDGWTSSSSPNQSSLL
ncbi:hypothetical protein RHMOL_Rhmol08G0209900 [Rhododendron molle]|uniref:Uncharacterized protein n=1 Tax=Rhododendron molle TaxID=49168 RepID=A0ACC0MS63_RHOML|nr:hypothetical protein RHMOL_Rhmol08G0209900 [Rhododendron molle]